MPKGAIRFSRTELDGIRPSAAEPFPSSDKLSLCRHTYFHDEALGLRAGVWHGTPFVGELAPHPVNEFAIIPEGHVVIADAAGTETRIDAGGAFTIPKGFTCRWRQDVPVLKYFVTCSGGHAGPPSLVVHDPHAQLAPSAPASTGLLIGPVPRHWMNREFTGVSGRFAAGVWETTAYHRRKTPFHRYELMHVLEGEVVITGDDGVPGTYVAGDTFFIAKGMVGDFHVKDRLRKVFCTFDPG